jgi:hypothetical protein
VKRASSDTCGSADAPTRPGSRTARSFGREQGLRWPPPVDAERLAGDPMRMGQAGQAGQARKVTGSVMSLSAPRRPATDRLVAKRTD